MKQKLNLTAASPTEQRVLDYLTENASDILAEKINTGKKTIAGSLTHATAEARKMADGASSVCIDDATVFGWIIHFFEEDDIAEPKPEKKQGVRLPAVAKQAAAPQPKKKIANKMQNSGLIQVEFL